MKNEEQKHELTNEEKVIVRRWHKAIHQKGDVINPVHGYNELREKYPSQVTEYMKTLNPNYSNYEFYKKKNI